MDGICEQINPFLFRLLLVMVFIIVIKTNLGQGLNWIGQNRSCLHDYASCDPYLSAWQTLYNWKLQAMGLIGHPPPTTHQPVRTGPPLHGMNYMPGNCTQSSSIQPLKDCSHLPTPYTADSILITVQCDDICSMSNTLRSYCLTPSRLM